MKEDDSKIIIALDFPNKKEAIDFSSKIDPKKARLKVGKELFTKSGPDIVYELQKKGFDIFLDLKFHDIPNTVINACKEAANLGVWMVNVHASGGRKMMEELAKSFIGQKKRPYLIAVTVLTSMSEDIFKELKYSVSIKEYVEHLSKMTKECGLDGVVCPANEASMLRKKIGDDFLLVTPGIRPLDYKNKGDDQKRVATPKEAISDGSSYLVIGRPITRAKDPEKALSEIILSL